jgi:alkaline phosphatase D
MRSEEFLRRAFLARTSQYLALTLVSPYVSFAQPKLSRDPFTLGIASGDPLPDGIILWTRLAPEPLAGGGMLNERVDVEWVVGADEKLSRIVKRGKATASPEHAHSIHAEVRGLDPARWYWYQFRVGQYASAIGRTRTAPDSRSPLKKLSFAFASCQHYEAGYFTAYRHIVEEDIELIVHLGDYIYEGPTQQGRARLHNSGEILTLSDYRNRYALYRSDPDLQKAHALFPWVVTWDDHEVDNNYADDKEENGAARETFMERRASAYQAYYEHMPLRRASLPQGTKLLLYRRLAFGDFASSQCWTRGSIGPTSLAATVISRCVRKRWQKGRPCWGPTRRSGSCKDSSGPKQSGISSRSR